ncbi:mitochondrial carrier domain-containing protein [Pisolithus marmoratus]|nr:mitochondrial carrier domain-containing protein [Pisolithus marmoratus]
MYSQVAVLDAAARFRWTLDCLVQTWRNEGIRGLYRGLPVPIFGAMAETAGLFLTYSQLQSLLLWCSSDVFRQPSLPELGLAAAGSGFLTSFIITPIELVKCKMQVQMLTTPPRIPDFNTHPPTFIHAASVSSSLPRQHRHTASQRFRELPGLKGLWVGHGNGCMVCIEGVFASLLLARRTQASSLSGTQGSFTEMPRDNVELLPWESAVSGALAGAIYRLSLYPADTVKSAIQTADDLRPPETFTPSEELSKRPRSFWETAKAMYKARGVRGLYAGCGMTVARAIPSSAIVFVVYDGLNQRL